MKKLLEIFKNYRILILIVWILIIVIIWLIWKWSDNKTSIWWTDNWSVEIINSVSDSWTNFYNEIWFKTEKDFYSAEYTLKSVLDDQKNTMTLVNWDKSIEIIDAWILNSKFIHLKQSCYNLQIASYIKELTEWKKLRISSFDHNSKVWIVMLWNEKLSEKLKKSWYINSKDSKNFNKNLILCMDIEKINSLKK